MAAARASRLAGEALLAEATRKKNHALQEKANESIEAAWLQMRDEAHFGTVFLNANNPNNPGIEMYRGLPLQFVADAKVVLVR